MNAHDGGVLAHWFDEPMSVADRFRASITDLPMLVAESRQRQDRQAREADASVERLLATVFDAGAPHNGR